MALSKILNYEVQRLFQDKVPKEKNLSRQRDDVVLRLEVKPHVRSYIY